MGSRKVKTHSTWRDRNSVPTWIFVAANILVWAYASLVVYVLLHAGKDLVDRLARLENTGSAPLVLGVTLTLTGAVSIHVSQAALPPAARPWPFRSRGRRASPATGARLVRKKIILARLPAGARSAVVMTKKQVDPAEGDPPSPRPTPTSRLSSDCDS